MTDAATRKRQIDAIWRKTPADYKGHWNGERSIMVYRQGTCLILLKDLTEEEIADRLPKDFR